MQPLLTHVAGVDVHKDLLVITVLIGELSESPQLHRLRSGTMTDDLQRSGEQLINLGVKHVAMESSGIYWKPVYNIWKRLGIIVTLGNAYHIKNVPGRKTDISDSEWIAMLHRCGLIHGSFIPDEEFQQFRALTRHRSYLTCDLTRVKNRVQKILEDGNIKLASVISDVFGVGGMAVLRAIGQGNTDAAQLTDCIQTNVKKSKEEIKKSLTNCFTEVHVFQVQEYLRQYDGLQESLMRVTREIDTRMQKYSDIIERLDEVPGIDRITAQGILAEATNNMGAFQEDRRFAAWAGVVPGNHQSAGKKKELR